MKTNWPVLLYTCACVVGRLIVIYKIEETVGKSEPVLASDELDSDDLYVKYKKLQQQLEFLEVQEEYIKVIFFTFWWEIYIIDFYFPHISYLRRYVMCHNFPKGGDARTTSRCLKKVVAISSTSS